MQVLFTKLLLVLALGLLALGTWINDVAIADAMFIFAAFAIGGVWSKYSAAAEAEAEEMPADLPAA
ncbi:hypothetical protein SAMN05444273_102129 [Litoreibacter ascidiaceicola]|uniref:Uncharacterized protein n=1 Tax=Litoreibacter ascidiaceicola TaxID=1486859 RepID=A0A1M4V5H6_9RHOB|nr:hypothetical protein [Litoreibacter ascidiaceicola]SHE64133.1 hypothetical protein SAMN05444273_102129 [Litoreibacter ascidiaceicola]